jgi:branched-chain amino acid aminotransferase
VFVVKNSRLLTPLTTDGALAGVTRAVVLRLARTCNITAEETSLTPYDLYTADECFLSGTGIELVAVREVDGRVVSTCPGPVFTRLQQAFENFVSDYSCSETYFGKEGL